MEHDLPALKRTAYALGELEAADRPTVEADLASNPAGRRQVQEVRDLAAVLTGALAAERVSGLSEIQHLALESRIEQLSEEAAEASRARVMRQRMLFWIPTSIAACALLASGITLFMLSMQQAQNNPTVVVQPGKNEIIEPARPRTADIVKQFNEHFLTQPPVGTVAYFSPHVAPVVTPQTKAGEFHAFHPVAITPLSSFPLNIDPTTYAFVQKFLERGTLPPKDAVQIESMVNAYEYPVAADEKQSEALIVRTEISECPWKPGHRLARVVLRAKGDANGQDRPIVAEDVRVRVEFNPGRVASYRLIGYENRWPVEGSDPSQQRTDIQAGHTLTVLYEIVPTGIDARPGDNLGARLKYQKPAQLTPFANTDELFTVTMMYRSPDDPLSRIVDIAAIDQDLRLAQSTDDFRFAAAVAQFGLLLMDSPAKGEAGYESVRVLAEQSLGADAKGDRARFIKLVEQAEKIVLN